MGIKTAAASDRAALRPDGEPATWAFGLRDGDDGADPQAGGAASSQGSAHPVEATWVPKGH